jgi:hypothetical protein
LTHPGLSDACAPRGGPGAPLRHELFYLDNISKEFTPKPVTLPRRALTSAEFYQLADVPPETEWFANIDNLPLDHDADIAKVQEWLGHANIATTPHLRPA